VASLATLPDLIAAPVAIARASLRCECGERKEFAAECCERCAFLDGISLAARNRRASVREDVIASLRLVERMTLRDLAIAIFGYADKNTSSRSVLRTLRQLERERRAIEHLRAVMATLARAAGGPAETQAWRAAAAFLAEQGYVAPEVEEMQRVSGEWEGRR
jgi:hypothetical protein